MNTASTSVRDLSDAKAKRDLLDSYIAECERIDIFKAELDADSMPASTDEYAITHEERLEVFERRRDRLHQELVNKGIRINAEASDTLPSIARAHAQSVGLDDSAGPAGANALSANQPKAWQLPQV